MPGTITGVHMVGPSSGSTPTLDMRFGASSSWKKRTCRRRTGSSTARPGPRNGSGCVVATRVHRGAGESSGQLQRSFGKSNRAYTSYEPNVV